MIIRPSLPLTRASQVFNSKLAVWGGMLTLTDGTDTATVAGTRYWSSIVVPMDMPLTGIGYLIGATGGTDKVIVELHDSAGALIATSALAGVTVSTAGTIQQVPFVTPIEVIGPGIYFLAIQTNGTTSTFRSLAAGTSASQTVVTGSATGTFGTSASIATPGTTFTAGKGPIAFTY